MKKLLTLALVLFALTLNAQVKLVVNGQEHQGRKLDDGIYKFDSANSIVIPYETFQRILADIEYYRVLEKQDSIKIAELYKIIKAYDTLGTSADTLIKSQRALIKTADDLYKGYKNLYNDLQRLYDINKFSIIPGVGVVNIPDISPQTNLVFNLGFEYQRVNLNALMGKKYQGLTVGYRIRF